ncbi:hypothetical protein ASE67_02495 [Sphingomonas sp. Leaf23]|uniref:hypothetical protein n=1 Tax=Sphingomonas sp. Leaf23 TaxID=1735689 RepID=UPI0006F604B9|nr:hypothetical protein [Sphingomonas sp. Leaf23]KQM88629.1 hypothetical protein ASE67_02495 [Sphingomonas sp. Leaf23]
MTPADGGAADLEYLCAAIMGWLVKHPDDHRRLTEAVTSGVVIAMSELNSQRARADQAMLAALSLCDGRRLPSDMRTILYQRIAKAINEGSASPVERRALSLARGEQP